MPRPVRIHLEGALYYVTCKAAEGRKLFQDAADYEAYQALLKATRSQFGLKLFAYALFADSVFLLLELTNTSTISEIMHAINSRYTKHVAKRTGIGGHVFQERFRSTLAEKAPALAALTAVVHRLPEDYAGVQEARTYRWSSYATYVAGGKPMNGMDLSREVGEVLIALRTGIGYEAFVVGLTDEIRQRWQQDLQQGVIGSDTFRRQVESKRQAQAVKAAAQTPSGATAPAAAPRPRQGWLTATAVTASLIVALTSLGAAITSTQHATRLSRNLSALKRTQNSISRMAQSVVSAGNPSATLATFTKAPQLGGTVWDIQVAVKDGAAAVPIQEDQLAFDAGKVTSRLLSGEGFAATNYSLTLQPDGSLRWETMATGKSGEVVCWQGEVSGEQMRGIMTRQLPAEPLVNFSFVGVAKPQRDMNHATREI